MQVGQRIRLRIERLTTGGEGVGRHDGMAIFVPYSAPGDEVEAVVTRTQKRFARAALQTIHAASFDRVEAPCAYYGDCGGCTLQHLKYEGQLKAKRSFVQESLERLGGLKGIEVLPVLGMKDPWRYRNKVQQPVGWDGRRLVTGFYAQGSHDIVPIEECLVQPELSVKLINRTRALLETHRIRAYSDAHANGWIRHLLVRTSQDGKAMLIFVTHNATFPHEKEIVKTLTHEFQDLVAIHQNVQPARTNVILGRVWRKLHGADALEERLGHLRFRLSPGAFFQVNSSQAEVLYNVVKRMAGRGERLLDLYAGVGTIALWLADAFQEIGGIEEFPGAVRDAEANAELNNIDNVRFMAQSTERFLGGLSRDRRPLTVVLDPPRAGCAPAALRSLLAISPSTLIYVSCDPGTLARDLGHLTQGGYRVEAVQPVDLFPHTAHIETAVKLTYGR